MLIAEQIVIDNFNPRPRKEGDTFQKLQYLTKQFQSTPSQRGRRTCTVKTFTERYISIHALAKRATECSCS